MRLHTQRQSAMRRWVGIAFVALALTMVGCRNPGQPAQVSASGSGSLSVHVLRTSAFPQNHIPPLDKAVTDPAKAQALAAALNALPPFPRGIFSCPADWGIAYHLTFSRGHTVISSASVKPDGCEAVTLSKGDVRWAAGQDQFWTAFANALGVPRSDLFQGPQPSGPSAPQPAPDQS